MKRNLVAWAQELREKEALSHETSNEELLGCADEGNEASEGSGHLQQVKMQVQENRAIAARELYQHMFPR